MKPPVAFETLPRASLGEGPWWDVASQLLYWVDIPGHKIHRFDPVGGLCETQEIGTYVSFVVLDAQGAVVAGLRDGIYKMAFGGVHRTLIGRPDMHPENRFNDGKCDRRGRLWAGTMHLEASRDRAPSGALYRQTANGLEIVEADIGISNGLGWSPDGRKMYFSETFAGIIWVYDYHPETGRASDRRIFAEIDSEEGVPDGLTVDSQGRVLVALWRAGRIDVFDPAGARVEVIRLPVPCPTSCGFGGADLKTLYITTAQASVGDEPLAPHAGRLFACRMDVAGIAEARLA